jgi:hypothetical protein
MAEEEVDGSSPRFAAAMARIDAVNAGDPRRETWEGREHPGELLYSQRMSAWLERLEPEASEALRLAARAQHIARWKIPRSRYPMDRQGYKQWRTELGRFHAETAADILRESGYGDETIKRVSSLLQKKRLKTDPECQTLEDVICLVFLEFYLAGFAPRHSEKKIVNILRRTWAKMSDKGREAALGLDLPPPLRTLIEKALAA